MDQDFEQKLLTLRRRERRFALEAYLFMFEALEHTIQRLGKQAVQGPDRHISGQELLAGVRELGKQQFGPLSRYVLNRWGIQSTEDIGEVVFLLVAEGLLKKRECDTKDDFARGFDFREAFERDYRIDLSRDRA